MSKLREGELSKERCTNCGVFLPVSGGLIGWTFKVGPKGKFCAKCAGLVMYPGVSIQPVEDDRPVLFDGSYEKGHYRGEEV